LIYARELSYKMALKKNHHSSRRAGGILLN
jgi:hypothetical protein